MKRLIAAVFAMAALVLCAAPAFATSSNSNMNISMSVGVPCSISANGLNFGVYTSNQVSAQDSTTTISVYCASDTSYTVVLDDGVYYNAGRRMYNATYYDYAGYELYQNSYVSQWNSANPYSGLGSGSTQNLTVYGRVWAYQPLSTGSYTDTVTATIYW